jgi:hypothetical protein
MKDVPNLTTGGTPCPPKINAFSGSDLKMILIIIIYAANTFEKLYTIS